MTSGANSLDKGTPSRMPRLGENGMTLRKDSALRHFSSKDESGVCIAVNQRRLLSSSIASKGSNDVCVECRSVETIHVKGGIVCKTP